MWHYAGVAVCVAVCGAVCGAANETIRMGGVDKAVCEAVRAGAAADVVRWAADDSE